MKGESDIKILADNGNRPPAEAIARRTSRLLKDQGLDTI